MTIAGSSPAYTAYEIAVPSFMVTSRLASLIEQTYNGYRQQD